MHQRKKKKKLQRETKKSPFVKEETMSYLEYDEFKQYSDINEGEFEKLLPKASAILDNITNHFYAKSNIEQDDLWRVSKFKQALVAQIRYFDELGATTYEGINKAPQSFTAGRTSVSQGNRSNQGSMSKPLISEDVYVYLEGTGLLYSGIEVR